MFIYYKNNFPVKIYNKIKHPFIDRLTDCEFCQESHISTFLSILYYLYCDNEIVLLYGFMSASLSNILKK
jgi:hypothetical protein